MGSSLVVWTLLPAVTALATQADLAALRLSGCGPLALGHKAWFPSLDLAAQLHVGPSQTRDGTLVSCIGRWILDR